ncbi:NeuD/PglB/VioB family sugar acetyltransferase [Pseudoalteromonas sp. MMG024]|uniref:acetyltransferase n=1 Tax=Pseudoalteromonas sp. MMG024 TaxID=2909980 RepID=UPI0031BAB4E0|nr:acetyltransferase [Pseudoalteromonas sp. MMG024]
MKLYVVGAGGHGLQCAETAELLGYSVVFLDDRKSEMNGLIEKWTIESTVDTIPELKKQSHFFVAIGCNKTRQNITELILNCNGNLVTLQHPSAIVSDNATIESGVFIAQGAIVNPFAKVACGAIINTGAIIEHECKVGAYSHASPSSVMLGNSVLERCAWLGAKAVLFPGKTVKEYTTIGANSLVNRDTKSNTVYIGSPARELVKKL